MINTDFSYNLSVFIMEIRVQNSRNRKVGKAICRFWQYHFHKVML
jgi:hypothetical protein